MAGAEPRSVRRRSGRPALILEAAIAFAALIIGALLLWPIAATRPQAISGIFLENGEAVSGHRLRFGTDEKSVVCIEDFLEATTADDGSFLFTREYAEQFIESFVVLVHSYVLCEQRGANWEPVWSYRTGPAPRSIRLACSASNHGGRLVDCQAQFN